MGLSFAPEAGYQRFLTTCAVRIKTRGGFRTSLRTGGESDFDFIWRLCEHEGIYYYFRHEAEQHVLVFADDIASSHGPLPGGEEVRYHPDERAGMTGGLESSERITEWAQHESVRPGHHQRRHYDFEKPKADLTSQRQMPPGHDHDDFERYEWPGGYTELGDGETYARIRNEEQLSERSRASGRSNRRDLAPGHTLRLTSHRSRQPSEEAPTRRFCVHLFQNRVFSRVWCVGNAEASASKVAQAGCGTGELRTTVRRGNPSP